VQWPAFDSHLKDKTDGISPETHIQRSREKDDDGEREFSLKFNRERRIISIDCDSATLLLLSVD